MTRLYSGGRLFNLNRLGVILTASLTLTQGSGNAADMEWSTQPTQPRANSTGCLVGKPFSASFLRTGGPVVGEWRGMWVSRMFRNQSGSTRNDTVGGKYSWILDCVKQRSVFLDHASKMALTLQIALEGSFTTTGFRKYPLQTPDTAIVLNILCRRVLLFEDRMATQKAGEVWIAADLGIVMRDIEPTSTGLLRWEAQSITLSEPSGTLFEIPGNYKQIEVPQL